MGRERKKENTRRALAQAAAELLLAEGQEGMTVAAIAKRAGVSPRTFHNYFPRREDSLLYLLERYVAEFTAKVRQAPPEEQPVDTLHRLMADFIQNPEFMVNLMTICDHLSCVLSPRDRSRVRHLHEPLIEALQSDNLSREGATLLLFSALTAASIAVESHQNLDEGFALLRNGFSGEVGGVCGSRLV
ncbi:transcriptional regulator BetI [Corynebacterium capitovis DSM 44611]|uniref:TetR/AcrR family transcriptional regulator n=1 Tax=Corynebacterium capitovis TaxID=131081 RepID=UPI00036A5E94|nr:TetR/AcrR family transcriptional regulator [Corynebacterium capitovis]WKD56646.1 transcriptional regulator BetI [Corynebacterium capitovis DSM 44611]